jgi:sialidase-1
VSDPARRLLWASESALLAILFFLLLLVLLAIKSLWGDADRVARSATGIGVPWATVVAVSAAVLAGCYAVRAVWIAASLGTGRLPGTASLFLDLPLLALASGLILGLFTQASDAVLAAELSYWWEQGPGGWCASGEPEPNDESTGIGRFDARVLFDGDANPHYVTFRIPGIVVTRRGSVLAYCEAREGYSDWARIDVVMQRSIDAGESWEPRVVLSEGSVGTVNNPVMIAEIDSDTVHLLYNVDYARAWYRRSDDDGRSWSEPRDVSSAFEGLRTSYGFRVIAFGPGHGIQLSNQRLLVPVWLSPGGGADGHHPQQVATVYSDDGGASWQAGELVTPPAGASHGEPVAVELSDGRVMINMRNEDFRLGRVVRAVSVSPDGAHGWTSPRLDLSLPDPISFGSLQRYDERTILFANIHNGLVIDWRMKWFGIRGLREPLGIRASFDDAATWPVSRILARREAGYVDLAARDGVAYALFEQGWRRRNHYRTRTLMLARFDLTWLENAPAR